MGVPKRLTEKQMKFAQLLVYSEGEKTATECAAEAGYEKARAAQTGSELRNPNKYPLVVNYTAELREEVQKKYAIDFDRHVSKLARIRDKALESKAWSAAVNAEVARGKAAGLYIEQKIIRTGKLEDMTQEELESKMQQIINDHSVILQGLPLKEIKAAIKKKPKRPLSKLPKQLPQQ
tara:strand:+ start:684 stop:1217 length:534 start_codon:yes stop_codon:yes gene_type:complete